MRERAQRKAMEDDVLDVQEEEESESEEVGEVIVSHDIACYHVTGT